MDSDREDCVRSGAVSVHQSLCCLPLVAALLEDLVDLGLGVDLNLLQSLEFNKVSAKIKCRRRDDLPG